MHLSPLQLAGEARRIGIGRSGTGGLEANLRVTLGSCVGVCIVQPSRDLFGVAHVLLPTRGEGGPDMPSRFADTAVSHLLELMQISKRTKDMVAFVAGGSSMFEGIGQKTHVGPLNQDALMASLDAHRIRVKEQDFGGTVARQLLVSGEHRRILSIRMADAVDTVEWPMPPSFGVEKVE